MIYCHREEGIQKEENNSFYFAEASSLDYLCLGTENKHFCAFLATLFQNVSVLCALEFLGYFDIYK